jgi:hypothetical protein|tara:strand:- start:348 stop:599 length:252 start_codon:yes stop_codon:yes gene_type:complete
MQKKNKKFKTRQERGLGKYDAPLSLQFNQGFSAFKRKKLVNPFNDMTMQSREWQRGFNSAYYMQLERTKNVEARRRGEKIHAR